MYLYPLWIWVSRVQMVDKMFGSLGHPCSYPSLLGFSIHCLVNDFAWLVRSLCCFIWFRNSLFYPLTRWEVWTPSKKAQSNCLRWPLKQTLAGNPLPPLIFTGLLLDVTSVNLFSLGKLRMGSGPGWGVKTPPSLLLMSPSTKCLRENCNPTVFFSAWLPGEIANLGGSWERGEEQHSWTNSCIGIKSRSPNSCSLLQWYSHHEDKENVSNIWVQFNLFSQSTFLSFGHPRRHQLSHPFAIQKALNWPFRRGSVSKPVLNYSLLFLAALHFIPV